jgi:hypothetical protein
MEELMPLMPPNLSLSFEGTTNLLLDIGSSGPLHAGALYSYSVLFCPATVKQFVTGRLGEVRGPISHRALPRLSRAGAHTRILIVRSDAGSQSKHKQCNYYERRY